MSFKYVYFKLELVCFINSSIHLDCTRVYSEESIGCIRKINVYLITSGVNYENTHMYNSVQKRTFERLTFFPRGR